MASFKAQLIADTYAPTIFNAEAAEKVAVMGIVQAPEEDEAWYFRHGQQVHSTEARRPSSPQLKVEPTTVAAPAALAAEVVEVQPQNQCCLENCDVIIPNLYLGGVEAVLDSQCLMAQGVSSVVCCNRELEFASSRFLPDLEYCRVDVEDMGREPIGLFFPEATEFIHTQLLQERPVLVHCKAGVSRSASVVIAYLIEYCGYSLHDAFKLTLQHRPTITPNPGFMEQLRCYEKEKCGVNVASIDIQKYVEWFQASGRSVDPQLKPD